MLDLSKEYGLVLEGGGAKGAYQVGVWKALAENGVKLKGVVGTSVGSLNGALVVQGDLDKAINIWENIKYSTVVAVEDKDIENLAHFNYKDMDVLDLIDKIKKVTLNKGFDVTPLKQLINEVLDEDKIRNSNMDYGLVTVSLSDRKFLELFLDDIPVGDLAHYMLASSYLPGFKFEKINGKRYLDGGFYNNTPIGMLTNKGYDNILVVRIRGFGIDRKVDVKGLNIVEIAPKEDIGGIMEFTKERAKYNIQLGYYDALRLIHSLKGKDYYIDCNKSERYFVNHLLRLSTRSKRKFVKATDDNLPINRVFLERGLPNFAKRMRLVKDWSYDQIAFATIEKIANVLDIERFKVYEYNELIEIIKARMEEYKEKINYDKKSKEIEHLLVDLIRVF